MCNGRPDVLRQATEVAAVASLRNHASKLAQLVVTVEGLLENELTVQKGDFSAHQLPHWFNENAFHIVGDAKWRLFCEELDVVKRGYRCTNYWLQQLPWITLGVVTVVPHSCFAGLCVLIAGYRYEQQQFIDEHRRLIEKFLRGELDRDDLSKQGHVKPLSCTNWEQLFLKCGYRLATSTRTEAIFSEGQEDNYFIDIIFSPTPSALSSAE
jgi:hypothetical protein